MNISAVVLTKNEEKNIEGCLKTLDFCNEIIVVDDDSTDKTRIIAKKMKAKIFSRAMNEDFSGQSNFGMTKTSGDFIFFVDADERVSKDLQKEIKGADFENFDVFCFRRIDFIWGKWLKHGESGSSRVPRMVRKGVGTWKRRVHPHFDYSGNSTEFEHPILHYPHQTFHKFVSSINRWSSWHAIANNEEGKKSNIIKIIFWPIGHFFTNYVFRRGFMDGMQGFVYASIMSAHSFLSWSKLWLIQRKNLSQN